MNFLCSYNGESFLYLDHYPSMEWTLYPKLYQLFFWGISFVQCLNDPILMFHTQILFASCFPIPLKFSTATCFFRFNSHAGFWEAFKPMLFWMSRGFFWVCQHVSLPFLSGKIGLIFAETIASRVYLGSWVLVVLVITFRFLLDSSLFLLEAIGVTIWVCYPFRCTWGCFVSFFP